MKSQKSYADQSFGCLYLVPTPIGNLEDMTFRGVRILSEVSLIAAEDTRNTQKLLNHFEIKTPQISFHEHNSKERIPQLIERLQHGESIAQVSDAGMPSISDPGHDLVLSCLEKGISVIPLPGANAAVTGLIASGLTPQPFYFYGFLPRQRKNRRAVMAGLSEHQETVMLYESPHRLKATLKELAEIFGEERPITLCRELTKKFEEFLRGNLAEALSWALEHDIRGEFCLLIGGNQSGQRLKEKEPSWELLTIYEHIIQLMEENQWSSKEAIKEVAKLRGLKKQEVYQVFHIDGQ